MRLDLSSVERAGLVAFAARLGLRPKDVLLRFVRDLTGSPRNGGSNERDAAQNWADASLWHLQRPLTPYQEERTWALDEKFYRMRKDAEAEWRREYLARASVNAATQAAALVPANGTGDTPFVDRDRVCGRVHENAGRDHGAHPKVAERETK